MKRLHEERGFTLIELAIVLVIIGIILGAVLKGQDLIQNARAKKFVNKGRAWEVATWTFLDRKGRFPGDSDKDGKIGDGNVENDLTGANFINPPYEGSSGSETNTITLGSYTFYVFLGSVGADGDSDGDADTGKNVMTICVASDCSSTFDDTQIAYIEALDVSIDGSAAGDDGQVIGVNDISNLSLTAAQWEALWTSTPTAAAFSSTSTKAVVYYFDAKR
jgi:prepilin-type N-terminal cleavage/methylation domain-containing protein